MSDQNSEQRRRINAAISGIKRQVEMRDVVRESGRQDVFINLPPDVILGYRVGDHLDFQAYTDIGFKHPKADDGDSTYYKLNRGHKESARFQEIYAGIERKMRIDQPIVVWIWKDREIMVLDGATRLSVIGYLQKIYPNSFKLVPVQLFEGTAEAALIEMSRRNLPNRSRDLTPEEMVNQVLYHVDRGVPMGKIAEMIGLPAKSGAAAIQQIADIGVRAGRLLLQAYFNKRVTLENAADIARRSEEEQDSLIKAMEKMKPGKQITSADIAEVASAPIVHFVNVSMIKQRFIRVSRQVNDMLKKIDDLTTDDAVLREKQNELSACFDRFNEAYSVFEKRYMDEHFPTKKDEHIPTGSIDLIIDESDRPTTLTFNEWKTKYEPESNEVSDEEWLDMPKALRPFAIDTCDDDQAERLKNMEVGTRWSIVKSDDHFFVVLGIEDNAIAAVKCTLPDRTTTKLEVFVPPEMEDGSDIAIAATTLGFDADGKLPGEKKFWSPPKNLNPVQKDCILKPWVEHEPRTHYHHEALAIIDANRTGKRALDRILETEAPKERVRRFRELLDLWTTEHGGSTYAIRPLAAEDGVPRYAPRTIGRPPSKQELKAASASTKPVALLKKVASKKRK